MSIKSIYKVGVLLILSAGVAGCETKAGTGAIIGGALAAPYYYGPPVVYAPPPPVVYYGPPPAAYAPPPPPAYAPPPQLTLPPK